MDWNLESVRHLLDIGACAGSDTANCSGNRAVESWTSSDRGL